MPAYAIVHLTAIFIQMALALAIWSLWQPDPTEGQENAMVKNADKLDGGSGGDNSGAIKRKDKDKLTKDAKAEFSNPLADEE